MHTTAAICGGPGEQFSLVDITIDEPRSTEVLVRLTATGMCHTDLSVRDGLLPFPLPAVLGHEGAGIVEEVGSEVTKVKPGDQVLLMSPSCGECSRCATGHPALCQVKKLRWSGSRGDGSPTAQHAGAPIATRFLGQSSFSAHTLVDQRTVLPVPHEVEAGVLAPFGCGFVTGAGTILNVLQPRPGNSVVIYGAGAVGLAAVAAARLTPATRIVAVDIHSERLDLAREMGATDVIDPSRTDDLVTAIKEMTDGNGADCAVEATGNRSVTDTAIGTLAPGGTVAVVGASGTGAQATLPVIDFVSGARGVRGAVMGDGTAPFLLHLIELYRAGRFPVDKMIATYDFADIEQAAHDSESGKAIKPVLLFPSA